MAVLEVSNMTCHRLFQLKKKILVAQDLFLLIASRSFGMHIWFERPYYQGEFIKEYIRRDFTMWPLGALTGWPH